MRLWKVIKEILRNKRNEGSYEDFIRNEYPQYRKEGRLPRYHEGCINKGWK